uniref:hypothetical protein n=1 Tax=Leuconostoc mesenteroides TaxID=1245 RepID=UPI002362AA4F
SLSFHNIKKLLYLIISDYALEIKRSGFSVYEHILVLVLFGLLFLNPTLAFVGLVIFGLVMKFVNKK